MIIRVLDETRANICDELLTKLIHEEKQYDNTVDINSKTENYFKTIIKDSTHYLLCYEEDNIIKGYTYLKPIIYNNKNGYIISGLYVEEQYRRKGIGKKLMQEVIKILNKNPHEFVYINAFLKNQAAINLYRSFGFEPFKVTFELK